MELTIAEALQQGVAAHKEGKLEEAERLYRAILGSQPSHPDANHNLGVIAVSVNKAVAALPLFKTALEANPKIEQFWLSYIDALIKGKQFELAKQVLEHAKKQGVTEEKLNVLGEQLASINKQENVVSLSPSQQQLSTLLQYYQTGCFSDAEKLSTSITQKYPTHPFSWKVLGAVLKQTGRVNESLSAMQKSVQLAPRDAEAHSNLGVTLQDLGRMEEAEASYTKAIALKSDYSDAYLNLCSLLDATNSVERLSFALEDARTKTSDKAADFLFYETLVSFRKEHYSEAIALFSQIDKDDVSEIRKAAYYKLKGDLYHYDKDYDAAFLAYENSNRAVKAGANYKRQETAAEHHFASERNKARELRRLSIETPYSKKIFSEGRRPTFLIGFPRSGTTLLDTILRTHSKINVVEEQPMLAKMDSILGSLQKVSAIEAIDAETAKIASDAYFKELEKHTTLSDASIVIDKLPLNILKVPLINQIFPDAKFILALRHPLDCILSCWIQTFKLNASMGNMVDFERIVDFYCNAMDILKLSQERYQLDVHRVRYEDLIENFEGEASSILSFLNLEWEDKLLNYQATARARGKINTPSYSQVIKPIYKTASYRWKHYAKYLEEYKTQVNQWLEEYGY